MRSVIQVAVRTIDQVKVEKDIIASSVTITHSGERQLHIDAISHEDAEHIRQIYTDIIEAQRKNIINIAQD